MTTILLIRHAVNDWVETGKLAAWTPGVHLNAEGQAQARALGERLKDRPLQAIYASPLERTLETAEAIAAYHPQLAVQVVEAVGELDCGRWQNAQVADLASRKMWQLIQHVPSRAQFPGGETMRRAQARAVDAVEALAERHPRGLIAVVSHCDIIRLILAHYLGMHLDMFQRIVVAPASISVVQLGFGRPMVGCINDTGHVPPAPQPGDDSSQPA